MSRKPQNDNDYVTLKVNKTSHVSENFQASCCHIHFEPVTIVFDHLKNTSLKRNKKKK